MVVGLLQSHITAQQTPVQQKREKLDHIQTVRYKCGSHRKSQTCNAFGLLKDL